MAQLLTNKQALDGRSPQHCVSGGGDGGTGAVTNKQGLQTTTPPVRPPVRSPPLRDVSLVSSSGEMINLSQLHTQPPRPLLLEGNPNVSLLPPLRDRGVMR